MEQKRIWNIIHESDDENGNPTYKHTYALSERQAPLSFLCMIAVKMPRFGSMHSVYHFFLENSIKITGICAQGTTKRYSCTVHSRHSYLFAGRFSCEHEICPQTVRVNC